MCLESGHELVELPSGRGDVGNIKLQHWALDDRTLEERCRLVRSGMYMAKDIGGACPYTEERDIGRIPTKVGDEAVDPLQSFALVP